MICIDSISLVRPEDQGQVVVSDWHGGLVGGNPEAALAVDALAAFFHHAGIGAEEAGVARLGAREAWHHRRMRDAMGARIGDGRSVYRDGVILRRNHRAREAGGGIGMLAPESIRRQPSSGGQSNSARS